MAPELEIKSKTEQGYYGSKVDIFALGVILFIMCIGRNPFIIADPKIGWYKKLLFEKNIYWN